MSKELFRTKNIIKVILIIFSTIFWIYFLMASRLTIDTLIIFDIASIFNSVFSWNFLLFLLFFPLPSVIMLCVGLNSDNKEILVTILISMLFVILFSAVFLGIDIYFIVFLVLYTIAHIITAIMIRNKSKEGYKNLYELTSSMLSRLTAFLVIAFFIVGFFYILPEQKKKAEEMELGIVNIFVADDLSEWLGTSYAISTQCTKANLEYLKQSNQFKALERKTDEESIAFTELLNGIYEQVNDQKTKEDIKAIYPNLKSTDIKLQVVSTLKSMPVIVLLENYFALLFMFLIASLGYTYLAIVFLFFALFAYVFNKIFKEEEKS